MKLSILIATLGRRHAKFLPLVDHLLAQIDEYPGEVELLTYWNNGELPIGKIRQELLLAATGDYVCFVDDDDWVPDYYVEEIMDNLGKDYVGFQVELYNDGDKQPPVYHSLKYNEWFQSYDGFYRNVTHLNPIRRDIAITGDFSISPTAGEDAQWARVVAPLVKTENYIDRVMYHYYHDSMETFFGSNDANSKPTEHIRPVIKHNAFRYVKD